MPPAPQSPALVVILIGRPVGIAIPAPDGFEFLATGREFQLLDGSNFRRLEQLEQATRSLARVVRASDWCEVISVPIVPAGMTGHPSQMTCVHTW